MQKTNKTFITGEKNITNTIEKTKKDIVKGTMHG